MEMLSGTKLDFPGKMAMIYLVLKYIILLLSLNRVIKEFSMYWLPKSKVLLEVGARIPV